MIAPKMVVQIKHVQAISIYGSLKEKGVTNLPGKEPILYYNAYVEVSYTSPVPPEPSRSRGTQ